MSRSWRQSAAVPLSPEMDLLILCARLETNAEQRQQIATLLTGQLEWDRVFQLADYHRLTPLLCHQLKQFEQLLSGTVKQSLRGKEMALVMSNMRHVGELLELERQLSVAQISCLFLKGPVTAYETYGHLRLRSFLDLDVLILRRDIEKTLNVLKEIGYQPQFPLRPAQNDIYCDDYSEICLWRGNPALVLDVHWDLLEPGYTFSFNRDAVWESRKRIHMDGQEILTLGDDDWLFFACLHVSKHGWSRLAWLVDIAEHLKKHPTVELNRLCDRPEAKKSRVRLLTTFALLSQVLGVPIPTEITRQIDSDSKVSSLVCQAIARWERPPSESPWPTRDLHFLAFESWSDRVTFLYKNFLRPTPHELALVPLPRLLYATYFLIRPVRLLYRYLFQRGRSPNSK